MFNWFKKEKPFGGLGGFGGGTSGLVFNFRINSSQLVEMLIVVNLLTRKRLCFHHTFTTTNTSQTFEVLNFFINL